MRFYETITYKILLYLLLMKGFLLQLPCFGLIIFFHYGHTYTFILRYLLIDLYIDTTNLYVRPD